MYTRDVDCGCTHHGTRAGRIKRSGRQDRAPIRRALVRCAWTGV